MLTNEREPTRPRSRKLMFAIVAGLSVLGALSGAGVALGSRSVGSAGSPPDYSAIAPMADSGEVEAMSDGIVTAAEREQAQNAAVQCMREAGLDAQADGTGIGVVGDIGEDGKTVIQRCNAEHYDRVALAWADQNRPTAEQRAIIMGETTACYRAAGGEPGNGKNLTHQEILDTLTFGTDQQAVALGHCLTANQQRFGVAIP